MNRRYVLIGGLILLTGLIAVSLFIFRGKSSTPSAEYVDPGSHETVSDPAGKSPDKYGSTNQIVFLGIGNFLDYGVSQYQVNDLKYAFAQYDKTKNKSLREVSFDVDSIKITRHDKASADTKDIANFNIKLNRSEGLRAKMDYFDISAIRLYLYNSSSGNLEYDSGPIDLSSNPSE